MRLFEVITQKYIEVEFVCHNEQYPNSTPLSCQQALADDLRKLDGVVVLQQDWSSAEDGKQVSLSAIALDRRLLPTINKLAKKNNVEIDLVNTVDNDYVDRAIRGEHEGQLIQEDPFTVQDIERKTLRNITVGSLPSAEFVDSGHYSTVYTSKENPHDVVKGTSGNARLEDGYEAFLRALADNEEMRDNIYMPRIRTARVIRSTKDPSKKRLLVRLERLNNLSALSEREAYDMLVRLIGRDNARQFYKELLSYDAERNKMKTSWPWLLKEFLTDYAYNTSDYQVIDEEFLKAYKWVKQVAKEGNWQMDLYGENWMFRRTPYGPQLVMIDPFAWRKSR